MKYKVMTLEQQLITSKNNQRSHVLRSLFHKLVMSSKASDKLFSHVVWG